MGVDCHIVDMRREHNLLGVHVHVCAHERHHPALTSEGERLYVCVYYTYMCSVVMHAYTCTCTCAHI